MAKKFRFRLQPVLKYRERIEDESRKRYLEIQQTRDAKQAELDRVRADTQSALGAMVDAKSGLVDMAKVRQLNRYITGLAVAERQRSGELRAIENETEKRRLELVAARQGVKVMEKLRERRLTEHVYAQSVEETKQLDEFGADLHRRTRRVNGNGTPAAKTMLGVEDSSRSSDAEQNFRASRVQAVVGDERG